MSILDETPLSLLEAAPLFGRPHQNTLRRWANKGVNGVRLETFRLGGKLLTTREACERFVAAQNARRASVAEHLAAAAELDELGIR
jgi:hypothetical protein